ncbi:MAG: sigma 54-interacting transcriptional regulator [Planctomycetes bacterium]|nr:sigma 54-interacting transcriptional regulator [Planctomycetota bacterium]MBI3848532.1 sigma 54-interacting transcriptional regulator [Planctomycetota bacterium]
MKKAKPTRFPRLTEIFSPKANVDTEREWRKLLRLQEINQWLNSELDTKRLLDGIMDIVIDLTRAERGFMILHRDGTDEIVVARNIDREEVRRPDFKISHSIAQKVRDTGEPVLSDDAATEAGLSAFSSVSDLQLRSVLCIPVRAKDRIIGTLYLDHRYERGKFTVDDLRLLEVFSNQAAIALENARLLQEARDAREALERANAELEGRVRRQEEELASLRRDADLPEEPLRHIYGGLVGRSPAMRRLLRLLDRITETHLPVVILGESGTGKELVARILHENGPRRGGPFVSLNCGAMPAALLESELFGHVRGAFTGAVRDKVGLFEVADRGTLFLDEVVEMEPAMQAKLLRVLENGELRPVGSAESRRVDVRILSATNRDLEAAVASGRFRADLYYRLKGFVVVVPPLRERAGDIPLLVEFFLDRISAENGSTRRRITPGALDVLQRHEWPGNVRELQSEVRRLEALALAEIDEELVRREFFVPNSARVTAPAIRGRTLAQIERAAIVEALESNEWRKMDAARTLGISRRTLYDKIRRHRITFGPRGPTNPSSSSPPAKPAR